MIIFLKQTISIKDIGNLWIPAVGPVNLEYEYSTKSYCVSDFDLYFYYIEVPVYSVHSTEKMIADLKFSHWRTIKVGKCLTQFISHK